MNRVMFDREIGAVTVGHDHEKEHYGNADDIRVDIAVDDPTWVRSDDRFVVVKSARELVVDIRDGVLHVR